MTGSVCANGWVLGGLKSERFGGLAIQFSSGFRGLPLCFVVTISWWGPIRVHVVASPHRGAPRWNPKNGFLTPGPPLKKSP